MTEFVRLEPALVHKIWGGRRLGEPNEVGEGVGVRQEAVPEDPPL